MSLGPYIELELSRVDKSRPPATVRIYLWEILLAALAVGILTMRFLT